MREKSSVLGNLNIHHRKIELKISVFIIKTPIIYNKLLVNYVKQIIFNSQFDTLVTQQQKHKITKEFRARLWLLLL